MGRIIEMREVTRTLTMAELAGRFEGKLANVTCAHCCGIIFGVAGAAIDYDGNDCIPKLCITSGDAHGMAMGTVCIFQNAIERIEERNGAYAILSSCMPTIEISEYMPDGE